jgi:hypothetical protein
MIANRIRQMYEITPENVALDMDCVTAAYERLAVQLPTKYEQRQTGGHSDRYGREAEGPGA